MNYQLKKRPIKHQKGRWGLLFFVVVFSWLLSSPALAATTKPNLAVQSAIAVDADTGQILYQKQADKALPIASTTKLLAAYVVLNQIKAGKLHWQTRVRVNRPTARLSRQAELTNVPLKAGRTYTVFDLYRATLIYSANAAISAIGTKVAGSPHKFVALMQKTAKEMGLKSAKLVTTSGITNAQAGRLGDRTLKGNVENTMSAYDLAKLSQILLRDYPEVLTTTKRRLAWFDKGGSSQMAMTNWNQMLAGGPQATPNLPVDGLKTGTSKAAGGNFIGTVKKDGHRIITVVMHASNIGSGDPARFVQTRRLMTWIYQTYRPLTFKAGDRIVGADQVKAFYGKAKTSTICLASDTTVWVPKKQALKAVSGTLKLADNQREKGGLKTPVKKDARIGKIQLKINGRPIAHVGSGQTLSVPAKITAKNERVNWFVRGWRGFLSWFG